MGVGFVIGGAIALLIGVRQLALPGESDTTRESVRLMLQGLAWGLPGFAFAWRLAPARGWSREGRLTPGAFWGRSLYFHLVSFIAAVTVLGAVTAGLYALIDAAYAPECPEVLLVDGLCPDAAESLRAAVNAAIVVLVAGRSGGGTFARRVARPRPERGKRSIKPFVRAARCVRCDARFPVRGLRALGLPSSRLGLIVPAHREGLSSGISRHRLLLDGGPAADRAILMTVRDPLPPLALPVSAAR